MTVNRQQSMKQAIALAAPPYNLLHLYQDLNELVSTLMNRQF
ncbi:MULTISPECIES: hypothetical protein [Nostoc]|nr:MULTISPECIES: hypothetical protein [Nostoc]MDZ8012029.1 hypothetical protein [Nostoc sp. ZfuVER08]